MVLYGSLPRYWVNMSGELHDLAALSLEKKTPVGIEQVDEWFIVLVETIGEQSNLTSRNQLNRDESRVYCSGTDVSRVFTLSSLILSAKGSGCFKTRGQIIRPVKYVHRLVLLAEEETVLQAMSDRVTEVGMEINVESIR